MIRESFRYTPQFIDHMMSPRHLAVSGPPFTADGEGTIAGSAPGASLTVWIAVNVEGRISHLAWRSVAMPQVVASTSAMAEWVLEPHGMEGGMTLEQALALSPDAVAERLGGLPARKIHETVLGPKALKAAVGDRFRRLGLAAESPRGASSDEERLCQCLGVTAHELKAVVLAGGSFEDAQERLGVSTSCGSCESEARALHSWFKEERLHQLTSMRSPLEDG